MPTDLWPAEVAVAAAAYKLCELPAGFYDLPEAQRIEAANALLPQIKAAKGPTAEQFFRHHGRLFAEAARRPSSPASPQAEPATIKRLVAITTYFNPCGYRRLGDNYARFAAGISQAGVSLWTAEMALDDDPFQLPESPQTLRIRGCRERHQLWQKERLLNLLIERLPADVDAVAWIDADVLFLNPDWPAATCQALSRLAVVQLFEDAYTLYPAGRLEFIKRSTGWCYVHERQRFANFDYSHPGFAWAARADWLRRCKLDELHITGGADCLMVKGMANCTLYIERWMTPGWLGSLERWAAATRQAVGGAFGYVPGSIQHLFHGTRENRRYADRWTYLTEHDYEPAADVAQDATGLLAWTDHALRTKAPMVRKVRGYFAQRREDD